MTLTMPARFAHCGDWWVQINRREPKPATETRQIALLWRVTNKCEITFPVTALLRDWNASVGRSWPHRTLLCETAFRNFFPAYDLQV
jgi:hypothetical protein